MAKFQNKLIYLTGYLVSTSQSYTINNELLDLIFEKKNLTGLVMNALSPTSPQRQMRGNAAFQLPNSDGNRNDVTDGVAVALENYGCWCARLSTGVSPGGNPVDAIDTLCRSWAQCRHCEDYSACQGEVDAGYAADVSFGAAGLTLSCPSDLDACTAERCACDLEYGMQLSDTLQNLLTGDNPQGLDQTKLNLEDIDCERALSGVGTNACCGAAPHWQLYNQANQNCVNGVLEDIN